MWPQDGAEGHAGLICRESMMASRTPTLSAAVEAAAVDSEANCAAKARRVLTVLNPALEALPHQLAFSQALEALTPARGTARRGRTRTSEDARAAQARIPSPTSPPHASGAGASAAGAGAEGEQFEGGEDGGRRS